MLLSSKKLSDVPSLLLLMNHYKKMKNSSIYQRLLSIYKQHSNLQTEPFNNLMILFCKTQQYDKALHVFKEIENFQLEKDIYTYNTLIQIYIAKNQLQSLLSLFDDLLNNPKLSANQYTLSSILRFLLQQE